jgi:hypothetical protein
MQPQLGDALIDVGAKQGVGFDECTIDDVQVGARSISFRISSSDPTRSFQVRFRGLDAKQQYRVQWNGGAAMQLDGATLLKDGLRVQPK